MQIQAGITLMAILGFVLLSLGASWLYIKNGRLEAKISLTQQRALSRILNQSGGLVKFQDYLQGRTRKEAIDLVIADLYQPRWLLEADLRPDEMSEDEFRERIRQLLAHPSRSISRYSLGEGEEESVGDGEIGEEE